MLGKRKRTKKVGRGQFKVQSKGRRRREVMHGRSECRREISAGLNKGKERKLTCRNKLEK